MLNFKFGKIVDYAYRHRAWIKSAVSEFFPDATVKPEFIGLFNEWLIFDFKPAEGTSLAKQYYLTNPDNLSQDLMAELEQILKTQFYDLLEIEAIKKDQWLKFYSFAKKKRFQVWDKAASGDVTAKGTLIARIGQAGGKWYLVGADPWRWPFSSTERYKRILAKAKDFKITMKDTLGFMLEYEASPAGQKRPAYTAKELKNIRKKLEKKYTHLSQKYGLTLPFDRVTEFIYQENYTHNFATAFTDLIKLARVPEAAFPEVMNLFQELWNFFPHKILGGISPAEKAQER